MSAPLPRVELHELLRVQNAQLRIQLAQAHLANAQADERMAWVELRMKYGIDARLHAIDPDGQVLMREGAPGE